MQFAGIMTGVALFGYLSDTFGRRWPALVGSTLLLLTHAATGLSPNYIVYIAMRTLQGFFSGKTHSEF